MIQPQISSSPEGILFIGEAPGDEEEIKGWPLVGPEGYLFHQALRSARLTDPSDPPETSYPGQRSETRRMLWERRAHSFTYVTMRRLRRSTMPWKLIEPEDLERLQKEIEACQTNLIVPLGGTALWALTGTASIDTFRGAVGVASRLAPGTKLLPTYDPRTVLQTYKFLVPMISDLVKVKRENAFQEVRLEEVEIWLEPTLEDLQSFRKMFIAREFGPLSVDIETGGGQISCISFSPTPTRSLIVPFVDYRQPDRSYWPTEMDELAAWRFVAEVLGDPDTPKLFQNGGAYDVFWLLDRMGIVVMNYRHDLRLVHKAIWPELPANLTFMSATHANLHAFKAGVKHDDAKRDA